VRQQLGTYDGNLARVGDVVYVRGVVKKVVRSEELQVTFLSKTTEYEELIRTDACELDLPELGEEPSDGTMIACGPPDHWGFVFKRDDAEGHNDRDTRRHDRHWWSYVDQTWVDWPYVVSHGGLNARVLVVQPPTRTD
jgi:hypothetical protein